MIKMLSKQFFVAFLLFVITGASLFCAFAANMPMEDETHAMATTQGMPMAHATHLGELVLAMVSKDLLTLNALSLGAVLIVFFTLLTAHVFREYTLVNYLRQKLPDIVYRVQKIAHDWLALFELSPNFA